MKWKPYLKFFWISEIFKILKIVQCVILFSLKKKEKKKLKNQVLNINYTNRGMKKRKKSPPNEQMHYPIITMPFSSDIKLSWDDCFHHDTL